MATTAIVLLLRPKHRTIRNPTYVHFFSSSTSDPNNVEDHTTTTSSPSQSQSQSTISSYFSGLMQQQQRQPRRKPLASLKEIRKNAIEEFRRCSALIASSSYPPSPSSSQQISFQELYEGNVMSNGKTSPNEVSNGGRPVVVSREIRERLMHLQSKLSANNINIDARALSKSNDNLKPYMKTGFLKLYISEEQVERLRNLRTEAQLEKLRNLGTEAKRLREELEKLREEVEKLRKWRTEKLKKLEELNELNERLKLSGMEEKETESRMGGITFKDLRDRHIRLQISDDEKKKISDDKKKKKQTIQRHDVLNQLGRTLNFMPSPPKENLVEKVFQMPPKGRRRWSTDEENILLGALKGIVIAGWKVDNTQFRSGYLQKLQEVMLSFLPQSDLRAKPHIDSKIKHWKKLYNAITDMLRTSGFSWNDIDKVVEFESADVWDAYCRRAGEFTRKLKNKPFPYYEDWIVIFEKDRAIGEFAEGPTDTLEVFERDGDEYNGQLESTSTFDSECSSSPSLRSTRPTQMSTSTLSGKKLSGNALVEEVAGMTEKVGNTLHTSNATLQFVGHNDLDTHMTFQHRGVK